MSLKTLRKCLETSKHIEKFSRNWLRVKRRDPDGNCQGSELTDHVGTQNVCVFFKDADQILKVLLCTVLSNRKEKFHKSTSQDVLINFARENCNSKLSNNSIILAAYIGDTCHLNNFENAQNLVLTSNIAVTVIITLGGVVSIMALAMIAYDFRKGENRMMIYILCIAIGNVIQLASYITKRLNGNNEKTSHAMCIVNSVVELMTEYFIVIMISLLTMGQFFAVTFPFLYLRVFMSEMGGMRTKIRNCLFVLVIALAFGALQVYLMNKGVITCSGDHLKALTLFHVPIFIGVLATSFFSIGTLVTLTKARIRRVRLTGSPVLMTSGDIKISTMLATSGILFVFLSIPEMYAFVTFSKNFSRQDFVKIALKSTMMQVMSLSRYTFGILNCILFAARTKCASKIFRMARKLCGK